MQPRKQPSANRGPGPAWLSCPSLKLATTPGVPMHEEWGFLNPCPPAGRRLWLLQVQQTEIEISIRERKSFMIYE